MSESTFDPKNITSGLPLLPFTNQVGGHASIFRFSKRAICKPASQKEQEFYEYFEAHRPDILPFLSQYLGVLNATYHQNPKNYDLPEVLFDQNEQLLNDWMKGNNNSPPTPSAAIYANMLEEGLEDFQQWSPNPDQCTLRFKDFQKRVFSEVFNPNALKERMAAVDGWRDKQNTKKNAGGDEEGNSNNKKSSILMITPVVGNEENNSTKEASTTSFSHSSTPQPRLLQRRPTDPWSVQVYERDRQKLQQLTKENNITRQFLLLEDLTDGVQFPCVLDLKMGTRQYGVNVNEEKRKSQAEKCAKSTSQSLGVRLCGMQVYKSDSGKFVFQNKYHGRTISPDSFCDSLTAFLNSGTLQIQLIPSLIKKLKRLARLIKTMSGYRFYGSSLLIIYDGEKRPNKIDLRMIDFAKAVKPNESDFTYPPLNGSGSPDVGYLLGLKTLVQCFGSIYYQHTGINLDDEAIIKTDVFFEIIDQYKKEV